ncbi:MAG: GGDEF domain-containing protein [Armatimonadota bacterium]|nr:GGDEF domain-containing protein [Armatimonadota bacterium]
MAEVKIGAVMTRLVETASPDEPLLTVVERMARSSISCQIVVERDCPVGIVTERDVVRFYAENAGKSTRLRVGDFMSRPVYSIPESTTLSEAGSMMKTRHCRRFPVTGSDGRLVGLVTQTDILNGSMHALERYSHKLEKMVQERTEELHSKNAELEQLSITDPLTGLFNRRLLFQRFEDEMSRASRYGVSLGCAMIDIDHFKDVNDRYGHDVGDHVLRALGILLHDAVRAEDIVARYGGEEFVVVGQGDLRSMLCVAERIRIAVQSHAFTAADETLSITVSCGVTAYDGMSGPDNVDELLRMADSAMYQAKANGRNRSEILCAAPSLEPAPN